MSASRKRDRKVSCSGGSHGRGWVLPERLTFTTTSSTTRSAKRRDSQSIVAAVKDEEIGEEPDSPSSPTGRIAKRNARALNVVDLAGRRRASFADGNLVGLLPELKASDLDERCPVVQSLLGAEELDELSTDDMISLQHQLESLLAENVDNQKILHGEITYLRTGDYPKLDVSARPMPTYTLLERSPSSSTTAQNDSSRAGCSHHRHHDDTGALNLADLGLNSSHEDDGPEPSILDVPRRFWRWSREYLKHIGADYVCEFREKLLERFSREAIQKWLVDEAPSTSKPRHRARIPKVVLRRSGLRRDSHEQPERDDANLSNDTLPVLSTHTSPTVQTPKSRRGRVGVKRKAPDAVSDPAVADGSKATVNSPKLLALVERMLEGVAAEQQSSASCSSFSSPVKSVKFSRRLSNGYGVRECEVAVEEIDPAQLVLLMNGGGGGGMGCSSALGTSTRSQRAKQNTLLLNGFQPLLRASNIDPMTDDDNSNLSPPPTLSPSVPAASKLSEEPAKRRKIDPRQLHEVKQGIISIGVRRGLLPARLDPSTSSSPALNGGSSHAPNGLNGLITPKTDPAILHTLNTSNDHDGDEVSAELRRKQAELLALHQKTLPLIETLFDRVEAEHVAHELAHELDAADDKLLTTGGRPVAPSSGGGRRRGNSGHAKNKDALQGADWAALMSEREKAIAKLYPWISSSAPGSRTNANGRDTQRQSKAVGEALVVNGAGSRRGKRRVCA